MRIKSGKVDCLYVMCAIFTSKQAFECYYMSFTMDVLFRVKVMPVPQPLGVTTSKYIIKPVIMIL